MVNFSFCWIFQVAFNCTWKYAGGPFCSLYCFLKFEPFWFIYTIPSVVSLLSMISLTVSFLIALCHIVTMTMSKSLGHNTEEQHLTYSREFFPCAHFRQDKVTFFVWVFSIYNGSQSPNHHISTGHEFPPVHVAYLNGTTPDPPIGAESISSQQFIWVSRSPCKWQPIWTAHFMVLSVGPVDCCCCPIHDLYRHRA
jgi:hypothetical protein